MHRALSQMHPALRLSLLLFAGLLLGLFLALPLLHQLHHDELTEESHCPVHLLQTGLILLFAAIVLSLLFAAPRQRMPAFYHTVMPPLYRPGLVRGNRAPPIR